MSTSSKIKKAKPKAKPAKKPAKAQVKTKVKAKVKPAKVKPKPAKVKPKTAKAKPVKAKVSAPKAKPTDGGKGYQPVQQIYSTTSKRPESLQPQGRLILEIIVDAGNSIERKELVNRLKPKLEASGSKQSAERVLSFYKQILLGGEYVKIKRVQGKAAPVTTPAPLAPATPAAPVESAPLAPVPIGVGDPLPESDAVVVHSVAATGV